MVSGLCKLNCKLPNLFTHKAPKSSGGGGGGGLPHERGGDPRRLAWGCKFQSLVLRVFWAKHHYIQA